MKWLYKIFKQLSWNSVFTTMFFMWVQEKLAEMGNLASETQRLNKVWWRQISGYLKNDTHQIQHFFVDKASCVVPPYMLSHRHTYTKKNSTRGWVTHMLGPYFTATVWDWLKHPFFILIVTAFHSDNIHTVDSNGNIPVKMCIWEPEHI